MHLNFSIISYGKTQVNFWANQYNLRSFNPVLTFTKEEREAGEEMRYLESQLRCDQAG